MAEYRFFLWGDVDMATGPKVLASLDQAIAASVPECLIVDCTHLAFIDSTGIRVLIAGLETLKAQGRDMQVVNLPHRSRRVFEILGLEALFKIDGSFAS